MNLRHTLILFFVLVGSDLMIGFAGHYSGSTGNDFSIGAFLDYVQHVSFEELLPVFVIAFIVILFVKYYIKKG